MTENHEFEASAIPQAENLDKETNPKDTTPDVSLDGVFVPVKYNKEIRNLTVDEAGNLAQKGLKYESIEKDYNLLKELANKDKKSVPVFLESLVKHFSDERRNALTEKCGGDQALADHILELENSCKLDNGFAELKENFPEIQSAEDLPAQVLENSNLKGTLLLDEYLRYLLAQQKSTKATVSKQRVAEKSSAGSLINRNIPCDPETEEFLKGLWK